MVQIRQQLIPWSWEPKFLYSQFAVHDQGYLTAQDGFQRSGR